MLYKLIASPHYVFSGSLLVSICNMCIRVTKFIVSLYHNNR